MKNFRSSIRFLVWMTLVTGIVYPLLMTAFGQIFFSGKANGSFIKDGRGEAIGSALVAQPFTEKRFFWPRPSAIDFNPMASGASNLAPTSADLIATIEKRQSLGFTDDLLFASGSGLDPHISPKAAEAQIERVAAARGVPSTIIRDIVAKAIENRQFWILGEPRVNVLTLNRALEDSIYVKTTR